MAANHIIDGCYAPLRETLKRERDANLVAIWLNKSSSADTFELKMISLNPPCRVRLGSIEKSKPNEINEEADLDVPVLWPKDKQVGGVPFLNIRKTSEIDLYEEIAMCGHPSGEFSLNTSVAVYYLWD